MIYHFSDHQSVAKWVADLIPHVDNFDKMTTVGITDNHGNPLGAVVYHEYRGNDIQLSCAAVSHRWLTKETIAVIMRYPFLQLGCKRITALVPVKNTSTRKQLERAGFTQEGIMRKWYDEDDCVVYGMLREECKWLKGDNHGW